MSNLEIGFGRATKSPYIIYKKYAICRLSRDTKQWESIRSKDHGKSLYINGLYNIQELDLDEYFNPYVPDLLKIIPKWFYKL